MNSDVSTPKVSIGGILSDSWKVFQERFRDIATAVLVVSLPLNVILAFLPQQDPEGSAIEWSTMGITLLIALAAALASTIAVLGTMLIAEKGSMGAAVEWQAALRHGVSRWFASFWTSLLAGVMLIGLFLLLVVPGVIFAVYWSFVMTIVALRGMEGMAAIRYSKSLVKGRWWKTFGYVIVLALLTGLCALIVGAVINFMPEGVVARIVESTVISVVSAFFNVASVIFFLRFEATRIEEVPAVVEAA